eukprot:scaffold95203_cov99-Cyclotella_meneghiniana.AAC.1
MCNGPRRLLHTAPPSFTQASRTYHTVHNFNSRHNEFEPAGNVTARRHRHGQPRRRSITRTSQTKDNIVNINIIVIPFFPIAHKTNKARSSRPNQIRLPPPPGRTNGRSRPTNAIHSNTSHRLRLIATLPRIHGRIHDGTIQIRIVQLDHIPRKTLFDTEPRIGIA